MQSENSFAAHLLQIVKAVVLAVLFCLVAVLIFSLVLKFASLSDSVIKPVNQFIKVFAILFGCFFALRGEKGWLNGSPSDFSPSCSRISSLPWSEGIFPCPG